MLDSDLQDPWNSSDGVDTQSGTNPYVTGPAATNVTAIQNWYQQYLGRPASLNEVNAHLGNPGGLSAVEQLIKSSPEAAAYSKQATAKPADTPTNTPGPGPSPTTDTGLGSLFTPFGQSYTAPAPVNLGGPAGIPYIPQVPTLNLPNRPQAPAFSYADFQMPTADDVYQDPSYTLRRDEGQRGIESSAAAQGRVRTGGTLSDILKYNQGFASSEYGNIVDRKFKQYEENRGNAVDTYNTNYKTQYQDPYTFDVQAAKDQFAPQFAQWQVQGQAGQRQTEDNDANAWQQFLQQYRAFDDQRKFKYGVLSDQERIGLGAATA